MPDLPLNAHESDALPLDAVEELFAACLDRPAPERALAIDAAAAGRPELADELRARYAALEAIGIVLDDDTPEFPAVLGDFRLLERLGGGGMGVVYRAVQGSLGREVALKLIRPEQTYFPGARVRFQREAEAIAKLQHPGIVPIYAVGEEQGIPYFAMELVDGCTLAAALDALRDRAPASLTGADLHAVVSAAAGSATPLTEGSTFDGTWVEACLRIARQLAHALEHAHERGLVHRDVKPSNVALAPDGRVLLLDFGLTSSDAGSRATRAGSALGTLPYMSPEQLRGSADIDRRSDVYSLGITAYEMLTLELPHRGDDARAIERAIAAGRPESLRARNRHVGPDAETVVLHALDPDPARRYPTAADFARDLAHLLAHRPIEARPPGAIVRSRRWLERHTAIATALVLGPLALVSVPTALYVAQARHARELEGSLAEVERSRNAARAEGERAGRAALSAERAALSAERALDFVLGVFTRASPSARGERVVTARDVVDLGARTAGTELAEEPSAEARIRLVLGRVYWNLGAYAQASSELERAVALWRADPSPAARPFLAGALLSLGETDAQLGRAEAAARRLSEALASWDESAEGILGRAHTLDALASLALAEGRTAEALSLYRTSLALAAPTEDPAGAPGRAKSRANLGAALLREQRFDEAADVLARALADLERERGDDPDALRIAINLALARKGQGRLDEAERLYRDALARVRADPSTTGETTGILLANVAALAEARGDPSAALDGYRASASLLARALAPEHPMTLQAEARLLAVLVRCGHWSEAAEVECELVPRLRRRLAPEHLLLGVALASSAACAEVRGDRERAIALYEDATLILRAAPGQEGALARTLHALALLIEVDRPGEARAHLADALGLARRAGDPETERLVVERSAELGREDGRAPGRESVPERLAR